MRGEADEFYGPTPKKSACDRHIWRYGGSSARHPPALPFGTPPPCISIKQQPEFHLHPLPASRRLVGGQLFSTSCAWAPLELPTWLTGPFEARISSSTTYSTQNRRDKRAWSEGTCPRWSRRSGRWRHLSRTLPPPAARYGHPRLQAHPHTLYGGGLCQTRRLGATF